MSTLLTPGVSLLGQSQSQIRRLGDLNTTLYDLQRQMTTQKKHTTFSGFGSESLNIQRLRMDKGMIDTYLQNIKTVTTRMDVMSQSMNRVAGAGRELVSTLRVYMQGSEDETPVMQQVARNNMLLMKDFINIELEGRYLFSGSATGTKPLNDSAVATADLNIQAMFTDWHAGTLTTAQLVTQINNMSAADVGFDPSLSGAGKVSTRINTSFDVDYTSVADKNGFQDVFKAMILAANLEYPDLAASPPGPTQDDFNTVLTTITNIASNGVKATDLSGGALSTSYAFIKNAEENHTRDTGLFDIMIANQENADTTEVITKIQALQTQLTASYQVTGIISQLSLVNFI